MRAIIVATGASTELRETDEQLSTHLAASLPNCMLTLADRPFLQHVVEYLIGRGFTEFDFVLSRAPEKIERLLGDGTRWGSRFHFHLARDPQRPYELLKVIGGDWPAEPFLLVHADYLPRLAFDEAIGFTPCLFYPQPRAPEDELEWTGWAWLTPAELTALPTGPGFDVLFYAQGRAGVGATDSASPATGVDACRSARAGARASARIGSG